MFLEFIIPYFGAAERFIPTLSTVFKQTDKQDIGIIIVDDNGDVKKNKGETEKVKQYLEILKGINTIPVTYLENETNVGPGVSRNKGLAAATAKYISFLDSDDYLHEDYVKIFKEECAIGEDFDIFVGSCLSVKSKEEYMQINPEIITWIHGKAYKLSFLRENNITFPNLRMNEDSGFNAIAYEITKDIRYYKGNIPMYYWMSDNPESLTSLNKDQPYERTIQTYIESVIFAYEHLLGKYDYEKFDRFPAQILQVYLFYCELLYRGDTVNELEKTLQNFFNLIHKTKWYQSQRIKDKIAQYVVYQNIVGPMIPEITFSEFVKKFEKESLNFK